MVEVRRFERQPLRLSSPRLLLKQSQLQVNQNHVQLGFEYLQRWRRQCNHPGQLICLAILTYIHRQTIKQKHKRRILLLRGISCVSVGVDCILSSYQESLRIWLTLPHNQVFTCMHEVPLSPLSYWLDSPNSQLSLNVKCSNSHHHLCSPLLVQGSPELDPALQMCLFRVE